MTIKTRQTKYSNIQPKERLPLWIRPSLGRVSQIEKVQQIVKNNNLNTICEEARCPNRGECYASGTATFLLGGSICTRSCAFCQVNKGQSPNKINPLDAERVAQGVSQLDLKYVVLTSVARDDLPDHGASLFTMTIEAIRRLQPIIDIEVLTPDFWGGYKSHDDLKRSQRDRLKLVLSAKPICFNHNLETVEHLQREVRQGATYSRSLGLLQAAREIAPEIPTKSGLMLGLGESYEDIIRSLKDLRDVDCQCLTLGQYLRPSLAHIPVQHYWTPNNFKELEKEARLMGFSKVSSGPLVRSSYHASNDA